MTSSPADHDARAWIAEAAAAAWWPSGGGDSAAIPLGVLAGLCLVAAAGQPGSEPDLAERICALGQDGFVSFLARVWGLFADHPAGAVHQDRAVRQLARRRHRHPAGGRVPHGAGAPRGRGIPRR